MTAKDSGADNTSIIPLPKKNNFTNWRETCEVPIYNWTLNATIFQNHLDTKEGKAVYRSGFPKQLKKMKNMRNLTGPIVGLHFMRHNIVVVDTTYGPIYFTHLTIQVKSASNKTSAILQAVLVHVSKTVPPMTTRTITAFVDHSLERNTLGTVTPVEKFTKAASLIKSHSI